MTSQTGGRPPKAPIEAVLLDLDGVLVDTEPWWFDARRAVATSLSGRWSATDESTVKGANSSEWARVLARRLGRPDAASMIQHEVIEEMLGRYRRDRPPTIEPGVRAVRRLAYRYPLAVASSAPGSVIGAALAALGIRSLFRVIVSSDEVGHGKPAPDVYLEAARRIGHAPSRCLVIEDSDAGVEAARSAGMRVVLVPAAGHPPGPEAHDRATVTLVSLDELDAAALDELEGAALTDGSHQDEVPSDAPIGPSEARHQG